MLLFFFNDTATTEIYTLSLHDALPISNAISAPGSIGSRSTTGIPTTRMTRSSPSSPRPRMRRSEEHTSELQSRQYLVCRLLLEKKNQYCRARPVRLQSLAGAGLSVA